MQTDTDDTSSLAFCQMMQAKDVQIRRLVLRMERCVRARSHPHPACQHAELLLCAGRTACSCSRPARSSSTRRR